MATTSDYLNQLVTDKATLKANLEEKGVEVLDTDTFTEMSEKVADIPAGGDLSEYFGDYITGNTTSSNTDPAWVNSVLKLPAFSLATNSRSCARLFALFKGTSLNLSNLITTNVTNMNGMFYNCSNLENIDLSNITTTNVSDMSNMFSNCNNLANINLSNFDTANVTDMSNMFGMNPTNTNPEININLSNFNTSNVTTMQNMFRRAKIRTLDLSSFDFSNIKGTSASNVLYMLQTSSLLNLTFGNNYGKGFATNLSANNTYATLDLSTCTALTHDSLMSVINKLYDLTGNGKKTQKLILGSTNLAKLTAEEIQIATDKGWTVS